MNYYRFYVGDYIRDTSRLSMLEHGAYGLMLHYYYAEERPLPLDRDEIYTMVRAMTPADRKAVDKALAKYFRLQDDGYHNGRADVELGIASKAIETAKENGKLGGRPKQTKNETGNITETETTGKPSGLFSGSEEGGFQEPRNNHPPTTILQPPSSNPQPSSANMGSTAMSGKPDVHKKTAVEILNFLNAKTGRHYKPVKANTDMIVARLKDGATETELRQVIAKKTREWQGDEKMAIYLRPATLFNRTKFAQYQGELLQPEGQDAVS